MVTHNLDIVSETDRVLRITKAVLKEPSPASIASRLSMMFVVPALAGLPPKGGTTNAALYDAHHEQTDLHQRQILHKADAKISVYDHGLLYGDGVFEASASMAARSSASENTIVYDSACHLP